MKIPAEMPRLKGYRFPREVVAYAVWVYYRFALSTADVEDLLAERGVIVSRETVRKWVNRFGRHFADCIKRDRPAAADKWHLDEVVVPINGVKMWLWRAVDGSGDVLDILVQPKRNAKAVPETVDRPFWPAPRYHHGQVAQLYQTDPSTGPGHRPPRPQRDQQPDRRLAPTDPEAREAHGQVQIAKAGAALPFRP